ncbi:MAG: hypothetical protein CMM00_11880 [Rhodopirellula sp.]|jgi:hypothetical protein|uniref:Uncharacterized protein n=1 Tax=Rhodopirellula europaea SH398 TaxID=1263868 RepID=M5S741_9BACT|nr:hypothetical protein RESH_01865 [Rhodopirellula europaea SH398]MAP09459.1 hypothetical protein [Rhodopirellula sp.]
MEEQRAGDKDSESPLVYNDRPTQIDSDGLDQSFDAKCFAMRPGKSRLVSFGLTLLDAARNRIDLERFEKSRFTIRFACIVRQRYPPHHPLPTY